MSTTAWRALGKCRVLMNAAKATATKPAAKPAAAATPGAVTPPAQLKGILKPMPVSPIFKDFIGGAPEISRAHATKKIWEYIKLHKLQNPSNRREIICDQKLKTLFNGKETVGIMEVAGLLSQHFVKTR
ncbi:hypothetical protein KSS87_003650 [Heliosperma pusillum]|nr:hypothetical protein KSS87_003650 [Heliosperma pusillum]